MHGLRVAEAAGAPGQGRMHRETSEMLVMGRTEEQERVLHANDLAGNVGEHGGSCDRRLYIHATEHPRFYDSLEK